MIRAYSWALADEPADVLQAAAAQWMRTEKFFPKPAELLAMANEIENQQVHDGVRSLPVPPYQYTPEDYERMLRMETLAAEMDINLHPNEVRRLEDAHAWKATQERGIA